MSDAQIRALVGEGVLRVDDPAQGQVQPASLDLRLGARAWRVRASFLPGAAGMASRLADLEMHVLDLTRGAVLETGAVYVVELLEAFDAPSPHPARANPKSSTGRLDVFARLLADGSDAYDCVPRGYQGKLWLEIAPKTFPILVRTGSRLAQLRFHDGVRPVSDADLAAFAVGAPSLVGDGLRVGVDLIPDGDGIVGWRARRHAGVVDVDVVGASDPSSFWEPVRARRRGGLILDPGEFYILASSEAVVVPPDCAAEMVAYDVGMGEFRAHYAGFFDPGFGWGEGNASRAVLEVRPHDVPFLLEHGQPVARLVYERMAMLPEALYGGAVSHYQGQGLKLSKHFSQVLAAA